MRKVSFATVYNRSKHDFKVGWKQKTKLIHIKRYVGILILIYNNNPYCNFNNRP